LNISTAPSFLWEISGENGGAEKVNRLSPNAEKNRFRIVFGILLVLLVILFLFSFSVGRFRIPIKELIDILLSPILNTAPYWEDTLQRVIFDVRLPRIVLAILAGGALSLSGVSYQTLFKNPMASPDLLGVSSGAGFGAALAMLFAGTWWQIQSSAFTFGILAVGLAFLVGNKFRSSSMTTLILAGIAVSGMFNALLSIVKIKADTDSVLPSITFWLMGSLGRASKDDVYFLLIPVALSLVILYLFRHSINALAAGDESARTLGVNVQLTKIVVIVCATFMTVSTVSVCGIIGWIGVIIPHVSRMLVGASFPKCAAVTVNGVVTIDIGGGNIITSTITMNAIRELGLQEGKEAYAIIKATTVMVGTD